MAPATRSLKGDQIPLSGRIVALADVYDALTSKRVYKPAFDHQKARTIILESKGTQFDPDVVQAFINREQEFVAVSRQFHDEGACRAPSAASVSLNSLSTLPATR